MNWESEVDPKDTASLRNIALACKRHLQNLQKDEDGQKDTVKAREGYWASRQCAEFNLWCTKVGVYGEGLRSIDVRLKDVPGICELLRQLLQSLEHDLEELQQPIRVPEHAINIDDNLNDDTQSDSSSYSFMSLSSSDESEAEGATGDDFSASEQCYMALQRHVEDTIDRLHGHALQIDRAGAKHRRERIELYRQKEGPKWAYEAYKELANRAAKSYFPSASDAFRQRMGESFARRRIRFEYLAEHQKKRVVTAPVHDTQSSSAKVQSDSTGADGPTHVSKTQEPLETANAHSQHVPQDQQTIYSATVNTKLDMKPQPRPQERAESVASSVALRHSHHLPNFVAIASSVPIVDSNFVPTRLGETAGDFEPYFCILEECKEPFDVPNSFDGLLNHLQGHLEERYHINMPDGTHKEFDETGFEEHLAQHGEISTEMVSIMKKASRRKGPFLFESCPFCGGYPDVIEQRFPNLDTLEAQQELRKHIKQHMQDIAFFLPPYREDILKENVDLKSSIVTGQSANLDNFEDPSEFLEICDNEDCDCRGQGRHVGDVLADKMIAITVRWDLEDTGTRTEVTVPADPDLEDTDLWAELFPNSAPYDRSPVLDEYYLRDEHLQSFIACLSPPSVDYLGPKSASINDLGEYNLTELSQAFQDCMKSLAFPEMNAGFDSAHTAEKGTLLRPNALFSSSSSAVTTLSFKELHSASTEPLNEDARRVENREKHGNGALRSSKTSSSYLF
ncbi:hypothetical protein TrVFT333_000796 [Trichoderma virens FT-333]|nr:hypothetical protein TrVFT333_000796 [Trichoderma virens FT-333]